MQREERENNILQSQHWKVGISEKGLNNLCSIFLAFQIFIFQIILFSCDDQTNFLTNASFFFNNNWTRNWRITEIGRGKFVSTVFLEWPRAKLAELFYRNRGASDFSKYSSPEIRELVLLRSLTRG